jgi:hypothetical protein
MSEAQHQMIVLTPRRRGRPRSSEPGTTVSAWIPAGAYDALNRIANERDISVSALVGQVLKRVVSNRKP